MARYKFSEEHDGDKPPAGVVRGTLFGRGIYDVKIVYEKSKRLFAGPKQSVEVPQNGSVAVDIPINRCKSDSSKDLRTANVMAQIKIASDSEYTDSDIMTVNYKCR